jgi:hypothetical protein
LCCSAKKCYIGICSLNVNKTVEAKHLCVFRWKWLLFFERMQNRPSQAFVRLVSLIVETKQNRQNRAFVGSPSKTVEAKQMCSCQARLQKLSKSAKPKHSCCPEVKHQNKDDELQLLATDGLECSVRPKCKFTCFVRHRKFLRVSPSAPERRVRRLASGKEQSRRTVQVVAMTSNYASAK